MILGRPTNLWLGFLTAVTGLGALVASATGNPIDAQIVAAVVIVEGSAVALISGQPPSINPGDTVRVSTPAGEPSRDVVVS
jgi:hypothetical protein